MVKRIIIDNLQANSNENELKEIFSKYGQILILKFGNKNTGKYAFIEYSTHEDVSNVLANCKNILGNPCRIKLVEDFQSKITDDEQRYSFLELSQPYVPIICQKVSEVITLVNMQKMALIEIPSIAIDNRPDKNELPSIHLKSTNVPGNQDKIKIKKEIKQLYGEKIYSIAKRNFAEMAGTITGVILTLDETDLRNLIVNDKLLQEQIMRISEWFTVKLENSQNTSPKPLDVLDIETETITKEKLLWLKLDKKIKQSELYKFLSMSSLKEKLEICALIYPYILRYGESLADRIIERLIEMDNAVLKYLTTDKIALKDMINRILQSLTTKEILNRLKSLGINARQNMINMESNIQSQSIELSQLESIFTGLKDWVFNYKKYLFQCIECKQNALSSINQIINELININSTFQNVSGIPEIFPPNIPFTLPSIMIPSTRLQQIPNNIYFFPKNIYRNHLCDPNMFESQYDGVYNTSNNPDNNHRVLEKDKEIISQEFNLSMDKEFHKNQIVNQSSTLNEKILDDNSLCEAEIKVDETNSDFENEMKLSDKSSGDSDMNSSKSNLFKNNSDENDDENNDIINDEYEESLLSDEIEKSNFVQPQIQSTRTLEYKEIFVQNLHPDVDESILMNIFESFGEILSVRVLRDLETCESFQIAYVTFAHHEDAKNAMDKVNFRKIYGKECQIKWSESDKSLRKSDIGNIFIKNLDSSISSKDLYDLFKGFGEIVSWKVQTNQQGESLGFAFVRYDCEEMAKSAIKNMNGILIGNKVLYVGKFQSKEQRKSLKAKSNNIVIKNLEKSVDKDALKAMFLEFGEIVNTIIQTDKKGMPTGNGFVEFKNYEDALRATNFMNSNTRADEPIKVVQADNQKDIDKNLVIRKKSSLNNNLYINKLDFSIDDERLIKEFSSFGRIISAKVKRNDEDNTSLGYGFVCFSKDEEAREAIRCMNGKILEGKQIYVNICKNRSKDQMSKSTIHENSNRIETTLNLVSPLESKQVFGELLYPRVLKYAGKFTGKIVGMFLELNNSELIELLHNEIVLFKKV